MNFDLNEEQCIIRDMARRFAAEVIAPEFQKLSTCNDVPYDILGKMADMGFMGVPFSEEYGGGGGDWVSMHLVIEEVSRADIALGTLLDVTSSVVAQEIDRFGTDDVDLLNNCPELIATKDEDKGFDQEDGRGPQIVHHADHPLAQWFKQAT